MAHSGVSWVISTGLLTLLIRVVRKNLTTAQCVSKYSSELFIRFKTLSMYRMKAFNHIAITACTQIVNKYPLLSDSKLEQGELNRCKVNV